MSSGAKMPGQWQSVQLGDLVDSGVLLTQNGFAQGGFNEDGFGVPHMRPFNISEAGEVTLSQIKSVEPPPSTSQCWLRAGDVLFNNTNSEDLVGKTAYWSLDGQYTLSNHMTLIRSLAPETVDTYWLARLLHYLWQTKTFKGLCRRYVGQASISLERLRSVRLPLPPIDEQRAIAHVLRTVQAAREARQREVALERERKAALMAHLFTRGTRGEPTKQTAIGEMPESWEMVRLAKCAYIQTGTTKGRRFKDGEPTIDVPYLRVANVQDGYLDLSEIKTIEIRADEYDRFRLQAGDVLMTEGGDADKLGRGFIWNNEIAGCVHQNHVFAVRVNKDLLTPEFLSYQTQSPYGKAYFLNVGHRTTNLASINSTKLGAYPVLLAPRDEQERIVDILSACDAKIAALERESALLDELFRALLEELMTGRVAVAGVAVHE